MKSLNHFLATHNLEHYLFLLRKNEIQLKDVKGLTNKKLEHIGVEKEEDRNLFLVAAKQLDQSEVSNTGEEGKDEIKIAILLSKINLEKYFIPWVTKGVKFSEILEAKKEDLKILGVEDKDHQKVILREVKSINQFTEYAGTAIMMLIFFFMTAGFFLPFFKHEGLQAVSKIFLSAGIFDDSFNVGIISAYYILTNFQLFLDWTVDYTWLQLIVLFPSFFVLPIVTGWIAILGFFLNSEKVNEIFGLISIIALLLLLLSGIGLLIYMGNQEIPFSLLGYGAWLLLLSPLVIGIGSYLIIFGVGKFSPDSYVAKLIK